VKMGDSASGQFMTVSGSKLQVDSAVAIADINNVKTDTAVEIRATDIGRKLTGKIGEIADKPGTKGADARSVYVGIIPDDLKAATELVGASVAVVIPISTTGGAVLAVPVAALTTKTDGSTSVQVAPKDATNVSEAKVVNVKVGLSAGGYAQVTAIGGGSLAKGDRVVVGIK
jgi:multidrug efflux pump subunit AcrA (membrane-fusion protein)